MSKINLKIYSSPEVTAISEKEIPLRMVLNKQTREICRLILQFLEDSCDPIVCQIADPLPAELDSLDFVEGMMYIEEKLMVLIEDDIYTRLKPGMKIYQIAQVIDDYLNE